MSNALVSIIVSCYNAEKYIAETLKSLLDQSYQNIEIIIVNDGSTDSSEKIIKSFKDDRIRYVVQRNKGQCSALNYGFGLANGSLIKFYDADDILHKEAIEGQVKALEGRDFTEIAFIEWRRFFNDELPVDLNEIAHNTIHRDCLPVEYVTFTGKPPMFQCGIWLIPRKLFELSGLWDERLSLINDMEFFSRLLCHVSKMRFSEKGSTLYRTNFNSNSLSSDYSKKGIKSALLSMDLSAKWLREIGRTSEIEKIIAQSYVMTLEWAFPKHRTYWKIIERRVAKFPRAYVVHTTSGKVYNLIMKMFGWKTAKFLSKHYYEFRYNKVRKIKK